MFRRTLALLAASLLAAPAFAGELGLGDPAPKLDVQWVKGTPVSELSSDGLYVVEFWATWCGPCKRSIPHLTEMQKKFADKVTFIGVSVWEKDQEKVAPFVEKMGDQMAYRVAMDKVEGDKGAMASSWMEAAGQNGIPTAFIVQSGRIAWIGHPDEIEEPLTQVVAGTWDASTAKARMEMAAKGEKLYVAAHEAAQAGKWDEALARCDELIAMVPQMEIHVGALRFASLLGLSRFEEASTYGNGFLTGAGKDDAGALNALAWTIVDPEAKHAQRDLKLALAAALRANELTEGKDPGILDTVAKVYFDMGDVKKAIEFQQKAVELSKGTPYEQELTRRLEEYKGAAKS
jgi:thiol-disulfide isomerase/thioredoxin